MVNRVLVLCMAVFLAGCASYKTIGYREIMPVANEAGAVEAYRSPIVRVENARHMEAAQAYLDEGDPDSAGVEIDRMLARPDLNTYERALASYFVGYIASEQGKCDEALAGYKAALAQPRIPPGMAENLRRTMALIEAALEHPSDSVGCGEPTSSDDDFASNHEYLPIIKVAPIYPRKAMMQQIEGYVVLEFTVNEEGRVEDIRLLESHPPGVFEGAAIRAVEKFRYKPRTVDGKAVRTEGVRNAVTFRIAPK